MPAFAFGRLFDTNSLFLLFMSPNLGFTTVSLTFGMVLVVSLVVLVVVLNCGNRNYEVHFEQLDLGGLARFRPC